MNVISYIVICTLYSEKGKTLLIHNNNKFYKKHTTKSNM